jgi:hypothetical protein
MTALATSLTGIQTGKNFHTLLFANVHLGGQPLPPPSPVFKPVRISIPFSLPTSTFSIQSESSDERFSTFFVCAKDHFSLILTPFPKIF